MSRIDALMRRFRGIAQPKTHERVLTRTSKLEVMTSTQAVRFRQLKGLRDGVTNEPKDEQPHYPLPEAARRLGLPVNRLLQTAAVGKVTCYVLAAGLRGSWVDGTAGGDPQLPQYLALKPGDCRDIETWGSVNLHELLHIDESGPLHFRLQEPLWVDAERVVLRHPLPGSMTA